MVYETWELIASGAAVVGSTVGITGLITKNMLNTAVRSIKHHCEMQRDECLGWRKTSENDRKDIKEDFKRHSHKALDSNGGKITL